MQGIALGQFVCALLAGGVAAGAELEEMANDEFRRLGVIVGINTTTSIVTIEDYWENLHPCWMASVEQKNPSDFDECLRDWAVARGRELGYKSQPLEATA